MKTRVSVILPVYNAGPYLTVAVASLLAQTHRDLQIIAIDDGSTDGSGDLLDAAADLDARVKTIRRGNRGLVATLNEGLSLADTDFVARMDADDIAYPERFTAQLAAFEDNRNLGLLGTNFTTLFTASRVSPAAPPILTGPGERAVLGRFCTCLRHPTVMFRRSAIKGNVLQYDPAYLHAEDFDIFRRLAEVTGIAETARPHLAYRIHQSSISATRMVQMCRTHLTIHEENMVRHYPAAAGTGAISIATRPDNDSVDAAADLIRRMDTLASVQPDAERVAYGTGVDTTVYFLYALLCRGRHYRLAHRFIHAARRSHSIRRRERAVLHTPAAHVGMALSDWNLSLQRRLGSRHLTGTLPGHDAIMASAQRLEDAAGSRWTAHVA